YLAPLYPAPLYLALRPVPPAHQECLPQAAGVSAPLLIPSLPVPSLLVPSLLVQGPVLHIPSEPLREQQEMSLTVQRVHSPGAAPSLLLQAPSPAHPSQEKKVLQ